MGKEIRTLSSYSKTKLIDLIALQPKQCQNKRQKSSTNFESLLQKHNGLVFRVVVLLITFKSWVQILYYRSYIADFECKFFYNCEVALHSHICPLITIAFHQHLNSYIT